MRCCSAPKSWLPSPGSIDDLAVEHVAAVRQRELGEVAVSGLPLRDCRKTVAVDERDDAEAVPLRLVQPAVAGREPGAVFASWGRTGEVSGSATACAMLSGDARVLRAARSGVRRLVDRRRGQFAARDRPGWHAEDRSADPRRSGVLPAGADARRRLRHLRSSPATWPGEVDRTVIARPGMLAIAGGRAVPRCGRRGDALDPPFLDGLFKCVSTGHFYGHLREDERARFLAAGAPGSRRSWLVVGLRPARRRAGGAHGPAYPRRRVAPRGVQALARGSSSRRSWAAGEIVSRRPLVRGRACDVTVTSGSGCARRIPDGYSAPSARRAHRSPRAPRGTAMARTVIMTFTMDAPATKL